MCTRRPESSQPHCNAGVKLSGNITWLTSWCDTKETQCAIALWSATEWRIAYVYVPFCAFISVTVLIAKCNKVCTIAHFAAAWVVPLVNDWIFCIHSDVAQCPPLSISSDGKRPLLHTNRALSRRSTTHDIGGGFLVIHKPHCVACYLDHLSTALKRFSCIPPPPSCFSTLPKQFSLLSTCHRYVSRAFPTDCLLYDS